VSPHLHTCGYPIIRVFPFPNQSPELILWYDGGSRSETYREEIEYCPRCGEKLRVKETPA
jgi:hypothetical protein